MVKIIEHAAKAIIIVITSLLLFSCNFERVNGSGNVVTQKRNLSGDFKSVSAGNGLEVIIEQGNSYAVTVEADDNLQPHIKTEVKGGSLEISSDVNIGDAASKKVVVQLPHIQAIEAGSGSNVTSRNTLKNESIDLSAGSGSSLNVAIEAKNATLESGSGGNLKVSGKVDNLESDSSSGSTLNARELNAAKVKSEASSGSTTVVNATESLSANASSGGSINYVSTPSRLSKKASSGGSVGQE